MRNAIVSSIMLKFCLLLGVLLAETSASWMCDIGEVRCSGSYGSCISHDLWCDGLIDCADGSDEIYCNGTKCLDDQFRCDNGRCVPIETKCNGYDNCGDNSDERCGTGSSSNSVERSNTQIAVVEAIHSLLVERKSDYGWNEFTPRALVALAFGQKYLPISEKEKILMMKRLDLQLLLLLKEEVQNLATLAHNINALYAMCKDPRDFHGLDLVELLRSKTDKAMTPDFNLPVVFLTLCLANESRPEDFGHLLRIYDDERNNRLGVKALTLIAMFTCTRQDPHRRYQSDVKMRDFYRLSVNQDTDVQSKALICQTYTAGRYDSSRCLKELMSKQSEDGSFGDLLGTYSAIPALLNLSLADLQCKSRHYEVKPARRQFSNSAQVFKPERQIDYSLWISDGENAGNHTLRLSYEGDKTFYDLMKMAEQKNNMYRFKYDELKGTGKKIYYLAGIPNDAEKGYTWNLYRQDARDTANSMSMNERDGVDRLFPTDGDHFIFQLDNSM